MAGDGTRSRARARHQDVPGIDVLASTDQKLPIPVRKPQGCTCQAAGGSVAASTVVALFGAVAFALRRRRRS